MAVLYICTYIHAVVYRHFPCGKRYENQKLGCGYFKFYQTAPNRIVVNALIAQGSIVARLLLNGAL